MTRSLEVKRIPGASWTLAEAGQSEAEAARAAWAIHVCFSGATAKPPVLRVHHPSLLGKHPQNPPAKHPAPSSCRCFVHIHHQP